MLFIENNLESILRNISVNKSVKTPFVKLVKHMQNRSQIKLGEAVDWLHQQELGEKRQVTYVGWEKSIVLYLYPRCRGGGKPREQRMLNGCCTFSHDLLLSSLSFGLGCASCSDHPR